MLEKIKNQAGIAVFELVETARLIEGSIVVIGCSSSEIGGSNIGKNSSIELARTVFDKIYPVLKDRGVFLAVQCCEHLNRVLIVENELAKKLNLDIVNVIPQPKAGGSFATCAYESFLNPVAIEHLRADAGMDIGGTFIGMHLKEVAVPLRLSVNKIGEATVNFARVRAKFVGGSRAVYNEDLL